MNPALLQALRFVHILSAAFWVGTASILGFFVMPVLLSADIAGARLLKHIMITRNLRLYSLLSMIFTLLTGGYLYWDRFGAMMGGPMSRPAMDYSIGGLLGFIAGLLIIFVNAPTGMKFGAVLDSTGTSAPTGEQAAEISRLARKLLIATRMIAVLTLGAISFMAIARYAS